MTRITGTLHDDISLCMMCGPVLLRMRNVSDKIVEKIKTHLLCSMTLFDNRTVNEIMWKNIVEPDRPQKTLWRMRIACLISKAKKTYSKCVILIAFPRKQQLYGRASMLRYTYVAWLVIAHRRYSVFITAVLFS